MLRLRHVTITVISRGNSTLSRPQTVNYAFLWQHHQRLNEFAAVRWYKVVNAFYMLKSRNYGIYDMV